MSFSKDFVWGAATASYQIEGAAFEDGRKASIWDTFSHKKGAVYSAHTGDIACDHYHRIEEDVQLMKQIGIRHYRFSVSWTRILPDGTGKVNEKGIAFYNKLINTLLAHNIEPWLTIFHWDYPESLYKKGGWLNSDSSIWFEEYTRVLVEHFSDRVSHWLILNEPQCFGSAHVNNWEHAPSLNFSKDQQMVLVHNILLSYGRAAKLIRKTAQLKPLIGFAPTSSSAIPASHKPEDIEAARIATYDYASPESRLFNAALWSDPIFFGTYPEKIMKCLNLTPVIQPGDMEIIHEKPDFYAVNHYNSPCVKMGVNGLPEEVPHIPGKAKTMIDWAVDPESIYWMGKFHFERYNVPILITENGLAGMDWLCADGHVHDTMRIDYTGTHLVQLQRLNDSGIPVMGYFHWSLMDNFEWAQGYRYRFGLIYVDYQTQKRTLKDSAFFYKKVIESNGSLLAHPEQWFC